MFTAHLSQPSEHVRSATVAVASAVVRFTKRPDALWQYVGQCSRQPTALLILLHASRLCSRLTFAPKELRSQPTCTRSRGSKRKSPEDSQVFVHVCV